MKNVVFFVVLFAVSIAKPTDESKWKEKALQRDSSDVYKSKSPAETIITKRRPFIIKSKISKPNAKKRNAGIHSKPKALLERGSEKSAITFALDSDDKSLSSIISVILKLLEEEEQVEKGTQIKTEKIKKVSKKPVPSTEAPKTILDSKPVIGLQQPEKNEEKSNPNTEIPVIQTTTVISQFSAEPTKPLNLDLQFLTTTPSNIILETSVSFEPAVEEISNSPKKDEQNKESLPSKPDIFKFDNSDNVEESSGDFSTETDEDSKHYCPDDLKDADENANKDSDFDLEKLISSSEQSTKAPLEISIETETLEPKSQTVSESDSEIRTETSTQEEREVPNSGTEFLTETESTTLEPLDTDTCLSETTTISNNILTNLEEILTSEKPSGLSNEVFSTTEKLMETTTFTPFLHYTEDFYVEPTEKETFALLTTSYPENDEKAKTAADYNESDQDSKTLPKISETSKLNFKEMNEITTDFTPHKYTSKEFTIVTEQPILITSVSAVSDLVTSFPSSHELSDKVSLTTEPLSSVGLIESSQYATTPAAELRMVENTSYKTIEIDEKQRESLKPLIELPTSGEAAVSSEAVTKTQDTKLISTPLPASSLDFSTLSPPLSEKADKRKDSVKTQKTTLKPTKPNSRLITFTLYDRKEKYTSLKHFIDYLKTLKK